MTETHEANVCKKIQQRREVGMRKYGVGVERTDLSLSQWLQHAQEEAMDLAVYLERAMHELYVDNEVSIIPRGDCYTVLLYAPVPEGEMRRPPLEFTVPADWCNAPDEARPMALALSALARKVLRLRGQSDDEVEAYRR